MPYELIISDFVENILVILSNLPKGLRSPILKKRLQEFEKFDKTEKDEIIKTILKKYLNLNRSKFLSLFSSWLDSLSELDISQINSIFISYLMQLYFDNTKLQEFDNSFVAALMDSLNSLSAEKKQIIWNCFLESVFNTPDPKMFIRLIPF